MLTNYWISLVKYLKIQFITSIFKLQEKRIYKLIENQKLTVQWILQRKLKKTCHFY